MRRIFFTISVLLLLSFGSLRAQESEFLNKYRRMSLEYNQDIKASMNKIALSKELHKSAKTDNKAKISANANFTYTASPMELNIDLNAMPISFSGEHTSYGTSLSFIQPIYRGGEIKEKSKMAEENTSYAQSQLEEIQSSISFQTDYRYWNAVARKEILNISYSFKHSMQELVRTVKERVDINYSGRNDLLMAEVKLNEADYQLKQAENNYEIALMNLNSVIGIDLESRLEVDTIVPAIKILPSINESEYNQRAKLSMAKSNVNLQESLMNIKDSKYKAQLNIGGNASYSSPGYNFKSDLDPNYSVYAKLSIPIFEWGKRRNEQRASKLNIEIAREQLSKENDLVELEVKTAFYSFKQSVKQVLLTESSLAKAVENESMAMDKYKEGSISLIELIDAQIFHQKAQLNYVQSRMNTQISYSQYLHALGNNKI